MSRLMGEKHVIQHKSSSQTPLCSQTRLIAISSVGLPSSNVHAPSSTSPIFLPLSGLDLSPQLFPWLSRRPPFREQDLGTTENHLEMTIKTKVNLRTTKTFMTLIFPIETSHCHFELSQNHPQITSLFLLTMEFLKHSKQLYIIPQLSLKTNFPKGSAISLSFSLTTFGAKPNRMGFSTTLLPLPRAPCRGEIWLPTAEKKKNTARGSTSQN